MGTELTSELTADQIEARGLDLQAERRPGQRVSKGDDCTVRSADGSTFIGTVTDIAPYTLRVDVRLR